MMTKKKRLTEEQKRPHKVVLPKTATSPTNSIYKRYDIVDQGSALWHEGDSLTIRSSAPFVLRVQVGSKVRTLLSKGARP